ncbi:hypothetical protein CEUSTIGMA_g8629.t1 [Chlamydomonas eustigma]|uniref:CDP-diacylglycerol--inositol 3-phosphatidyltransferase n=1 Tax=Chlamydomonas eustigma TaxID=1157962 RepID=A0A250XDR3_9CHLO|nr:hypothetical protein CEUSTIGMA_g8629.t1 [Chlamydomonas eustigma]|eukprot:GAX81196.1 hypothetical protein CEUSTIGMA_g8629.t1 [Chlamydomonas eustigma]
MLPCFVKSIVMYMWNYVRNAVLSSMLTSYGRFARMLNQTSTLGAILDMVTDRLATTGLLMLLAMQYPTFHILFILLVFLDVFSHWFQMYSTLLVGASTHKDVHSRSWLVRTYYSNRIFMGFCCVCCEVLYLALYGLYFSEIREVRWRAGALALPDSLLKLLPSLGDVFNEHGIPYMAVLAILAVPGVLVKQVCNWVQLKSAVLNLVEHEIKRMA